MRTLAALLAGSSALLGAAGAAALLGPVAAMLGARGITVIGRLSRGVDEVLAPLRRAGSEGRDATRRERRRLQAAFALGALPVAWLFADPIQATGLAAACALLAPRAIVWRRERYARQLGDGAASAARAVADALGSGHSTRAALEIAASGLTGPIGTELRRVAAELALGAPTDGALTRLKKRAASRRIDLLVASIRLHRRSGGNLAGLLRDVAVALEDQSRLEADARAETAQARFTSTVVMAMPFCLLGLGELASPGMVGRLFTSPIGAVLLSTAAAMQVGGAVLVRRIARVTA